MNIPCLVSVPQEWFQLKKIFQNFHLIFVTLYCLTFDFWIWLDKSRLHLLLVQNQQNWQNGQMEVSKREVYFYPWKVKLLRWPDTSHMEQLPGTAAQILVTIWMPYKNNFDHQRKGQWSEQNSRSENKRERTSAKIDLWHFAFEGEERRFWCSFGWGSWGNLKQ